VVCWSETTSIESVKHDTQLKAGDAPQREVLGMSFASNQHPMYIFDRTSYVFLDVNDAALLQYGYSRKEFLTMSIFDLRTEDQPGLARKTSDPRMQAPRTAEGYIHQGKKGNVFPVAVTTWQLIFNGGQAELVLASG
jgi:PAS domain S-box-containing protein